MTIGIIPARLESKRLPRKLLLEVGGKTILQYTWEAACKALDHVFIATDSNEIMEVAKGFNACCRWTSGGHQTGTDRIAELVARSDFMRSHKIIVNIQGDQPEIDPEHIDAVVQTLEQTPAAQMSTLCCPIRIPQVLGQSCVKVVRDLVGRALYFSREPIPSMLHIGIYAYRTPYLLRLAQLPQTDMEQAENLEQLRALQNGAWIQVKAVSAGISGIDTQEDFDQFKLRMEHV